MQKKKFLQSNAIFSPANPCAYYIHLSLASIFLLSPAGEGIGGGLDFSYRFKYPFIMDTNFHLYPGVDSPILATVPWFKNAYRFSDYAPDEIPGYAGTPPLLPSQQWTTIRRISDCFHTVVCHKGQAWTNGVSPCRLKTVSLNTYGKRGRVKRTKVRNLLERLREYEHDVLRFMDNKNVSFTNNLAENDIRMTNVQQKISCCFRSLDGSRIFSRFRSYFSTFQKQGVHLSQALQIVFLGELPDFAHS